MALEEKGNGPSESPSPSTSPSENRSQWKENIVFPTVLSGIVGGGAGLVSKHRNVQGIGNVPITYATNFAIVAGCYCGAREFVRQSRASSSDDLMNSVAGGLLSGAALGRLQGGQLGAVRYSILFAAAGTTIDFAMLRLKPVLLEYKETISRELKWPSEWKKMPDWSPIQILDEEALAKRRAREQQLYAQGLGKLNKEES